MSDKLKPIRLQINYILSSKIEPYVVPPILDPINATFEYKVRARKSDVSRDNFC